MVTGALGPGETSYALAPASLLPQAGAIEAHLGVTGRNSRENGLTNVVEVAHGRFKRKDAPSDNQDQGRSNRQKGPEAGDKDDEGQGRSNKRKGLEEKDDEGQGPSKAPRQGDQLDFGLVFETSDEFEVAPETDSYNVSPCMSQGSLN